MHKKPRVQTWKATLPHQIEVEGFRLEPWTTTFPHQIEVEVLLVRKKPRVQTWKTTLPHQILVKPSLPLLLPTNDARMFEFPLMISSYGNDNFEHFFWPS